ncbi:hypothetical protein LZ24_03363 [Desulfobotulus alkaliphilus]|uniref:Uncharacterized protein n=1 Tax=Desulfobotulus alkaliphilus TaxID=622671 RepID=A0A562R259_9BACT|nr:hypothetical protein [Desulfobotulus alkaliphilus]TWI62466.1 hypothetical protein LZ24_03363 [Desulfobotulus alkaliphilus]
MPAYPGALGVLWSVWSVVGGRCCGRCPVVGPVVGLGLWAVVCAVVCGPPFNLETLKSAMQVHCIGAVHVQMNRRRLGTGTFSVKKEWERMKSGVAGFFHIWRDTENMDSSTGSDDPS